MFHTPAHKNVAAPAAQIKPSPLPQSWAVEVIADSSGKWCGNGCRYSSQLAAQIAAKDLSNRWFAVTDWRVVPSTDPVNQDWLVAVKVQ